MKILRLGGTKVEDYTEIEYEVIETLSGFILRDSFGKVLNGTFKIEGGKILIPKDS